MDELYPTDEDAFEADAFDAPAPRPRRGQLEIVREAALRVVVEEPGIAQGDLVERLEAETGAPRAAALDAIRALDREGALASRRRGRTKVYADPAKAEELAADRRDGGSAQPAVLDLVAREPGIGQTALAERLRDEAGIPASTVVAAVRALERDGVLTSRPGGRRKAYILAEVLAAEEREAEALAAREREAEALAAREREAEALAADEREAAALAAQQRAAAERPLEDRAAEVGPAEERAAEEPVGAEPVGAHSGAFVTSSPAVDGNGARVPSPPADDQVVPDEERIARGDPAALRAYYDSRAGAVLAYCSNVCTPEATREAVEVAFTNLYEAVRRGEAAGIDLDETLLRATRVAAADRAPGPDQAPAASSSSAPWRQAGRSAEPARSSACALVPRLLAARASGILSVGDQERLTRHLARCSACQAAEARFDAAESAFRLLRDTTPLPELREALVDRFAVAVPASAVTEPGEQPERIGPDPTAEAVGVPPPLAAETTGREQLPAGDELAAAAQPETDEAPPDEAPPEEVPPAATQAETDEAALREAPPEGPPPEQAPPEEDVHTSPTQPPVETHPAYAAGGHPAYAQPHAATPDFDEPIPYHEAPPDTATHPVAGFPPSGADAGGRRFGGAGRAMVVAGLALIAVVAVAILLATRAADDSPEVASPGGDAAPSAQDGQSAPRERPKRADGAGGKPAEGRAGGGPPAGSVRVSVLSGADIPKLAARTGARLKREGFRIEEVANAPAPSAQSVVLFAPGARSKAKLVGRTLDISAVRPLDDVNRSVAGEATVVVIAGADLG